MTRVSVLPVPVPHLPAQQARGTRLAEVIRLVPHEHTWSLRETEYDNGFALNRFECDSCPEVRFT